MAVRDAFPSRLIFLWSINVDLKYYAWFLICSQRLMSNLVLFPFPTLIHMLKLRTIQSAKLYFQRTQSASYMVGSWINLSTVNTGQVRVDLHNPFRWIGLGFNVVLVRNLYQLMSCWFNIFVHWVFFDQQLNSNITLILERIGRRPNTYKLHRVGVS